MLQGSHVTIQCQVDAFPPIKGIRWYKDGHLISNAYNHTITDVKNSDSSIYTCQADNGIPPIGHHGQVVGPASSFLSLFSLSSGQSNSDPQLSDSQNAVKAQLRLEVLYPPRVQVKASKSGPHLVDEALNLNCSVDSSPPPYEYVWTKLEDPSFKHSSGSSSYLEFASLSASDMGNYTCTAFNRLEPSILPPLYNGGPINNGQPIERHGSGSALVQVRHRPGVAEIILGSNGETETSSSTQITCRSKPPGFPEPQYKFWKYSGNSNQRLHLTKPLSTSTYTILSAKPSDEGRYGCVATNEIGSSSEAEGDLIVNEVPVVIEDSNRRDGDARAQGETPYLITVRAIGKPEPKVTWYHRSPVDGKTRIDLSSLEMQSKFKIETVSKSEPNHVKPKYNVVTSLIFKQPLEIDDRGLYSVEFNNGLSRSVTEDFQLHINHPPIPAPRNQPILSGSSHQNRKTKAGFDLGETVNLTCRASAFPRPDFFWHDQKNADKPIENNSRYRVSELRNPIDDVYESTLTFMLAQKDDYGDYTCAVVNTDPQTGKISDTLPIIVSLTPKTVPDPPFSLEATDATQDSITIQWVPGFDGGFALNHYTVQYALDDGTGLSMNKRFINADSLANVMASSSYQNQNVLDSMDQQQAIAYPRTYDCLNMNPCTINHLLPRQAYTFRVRAKNERGSSEFSDELRAMTRANISQIPKILEASFNDNNILHFRIEPGSDYLLNNLNARIEYRVSPQSTINLAANVVGNNQQQDNQHNQLDSEQISATATTTTPKWEPLTTFPLILEKSDAHLNMSPGTTQIRITLCSRSNESICGPEFIVDKSATSSFLQAERGLSLSILVSTLTLIVVLGAFATTIHSCCLSRKNKEADTIENVNGSIDNKPITANGGPSQAIHKSSHGSTTSTNSTSAGNGTANGLQSIDSINNALNNAGSASDHSSDHSRQAKLDSMLPPNYNHYADRNSILLEQQQQHQLLQQQGLVGDKLGSPFGLPNSALLSVANQQQSQQQQQQQQHSPMMNGGSLNYFAYNHQAGQVELQQPMSLEHHTMMDGSHMLLGQGNQLDPDGTQQMWQPDNQLDDYNNYNSSAAVAFNYAPANQELVDPTYGTTGNNMIMSQQSAAYDNTTNSGQQQQYYLGAYQDNSQQQQQQQYQQQQQAQYQQEMAAVQQQMYGTLTRNGYSHSNTSANTTTTDSKALQQNNISNQQLIEQQYGATNGLVQAPATSIAGPHQAVANQESDYGTTGARSGRLIREIIV